MISYLFLIDEHISIVKIVYMCVVLNMCFL